MNMLKRSFLALIVLGAISIIFLTWYSVQHSKDEAPARLFVSGGASNSVLLAIDQINVNDSLIREVIRGLESDKLTVEVYSLADLYTMNKRNWSAIVIFRKGPRAHKNINSLVEQIKSSPNGFLVTLRGDQICLLEGGGIDHVDSVNGAHAAAEAIVRQVQSVQDQHK